MLTTTIQQDVATLAKKAIALNYQISCAESCTGGGLAFALTSVAGSSTWFKQSYVTYSNEAKHELLGVDQRILAQHGAVSSQTVEAMAQGCANRSSADISLSISGIAGPGGGSEKKPVGLVWFGICHQGKLLCEKQMFSGDRHQVREKAIEFALKMLLQQLELKE